MSSPFDFARKAVLAATVAAAALAAAVPSAQAQTQVSVELGASGQASRSLTLPRGKSAIVELPVDARDVLVSNPQVADAVLRTPRRIYVLGVAPGQTDAVFFDAAGRQILSLDIRVDQPTGAIEDTIRRVAPNADVRIEAVHDSLVLTGTVSSPAESDRVQRVAERFVASPDRVLNMLSIAGAQQVMVKVRVVEMQRRVLKQFGVNLDASRIGGSESFGISNNPGFPINASIAGAGIIDYTRVDATKDIAASLTAFERVGLARTLAEPNLTAVTGESARFLAGGEFPVPVGRDRDGNVTIEFKPFGVGLGFTPVVLSGGMISMKISTEVSELSNENAFSLGGGDQGPALVVPGLTVRRAETTVELPSGGAMMIAGLLQESTRQNIDALPGMTSLPVLGTLFRSRDYLSGETELVVIVEPYLVNPTSPGRLQTPADGMRVANDVESILMGRLNQAYGGSAQASTPDWQGPVGYVIE